MFKDKTVLITGGTGSFGRAVLERLLGADVREIRVFSRDEKKQDDMRKSLRDDRVLFFIATCGRRASTKLLGRDSSPRAR